MVLLGCCAVDFNDESCDTAFIAGRIESLYALSNCVVICRGSWQTIRSGHFSILSYYCCCCCYGLFSTTTWVSRDWKGKTSLDLNEARDDGVLGCSGISWTICKQSAPRSGQTTTSLTGRGMLSRTPSHQCQSIIVITFPKSSSFAEKSLSSCVAMRWL